MKIAFPEHSGLTVDDENFIRYNSWSTVNGAFLLNFHSLEHTLGICDYCAIFTPGYYGSGSANSTVVHFGNEIDARKMAPVRASCPGYFRRRPTSLLSN